MITREQLQSLDAATVLRFAATCVERSLPIYAAVFPNDDRPVKAVAAARVRADGDLTEAERLAIREDARRALVGSTLLTRRPSVRSRSTGCVANAARHLLDEDPFDAAYQAIDMAGCAFLMLHDRGRYDSEVAWQEILLAEYQATVMVAA